MVHSASLPDAIVALLSPFASLFDARTWRKVQILLTGVILAPGRRTVSTALYVLGFQGRGDLALFHHVLNRASWSSLPGSWFGIWFRGGRSLLAIDETLERRWGEKIEALGVYRDPVRSSHGHFVKAVWALPFLTVLAPPGATTRPGATATRRLRTERARCCASCAAGCPTGS